MKIQIILSNSSMIPVLKYKKSLVFSAFGIPARLAGYLLSEGRFRKPEQLPEFRNFQLSVGGPDSGTFRLRYRALDRPITTV